MTLYRRPIVYIPPYSYCDRVCARCAIDKPRCLLYQVEMDDFLHRAIDGEETEGEEAEGNAGRRGASEGVFGGDSGKVQEAVDRWVKRAEAAARQVEEGVRALGWVPEASRRSGERMGRPGEGPAADPAMEMAEALVREGAAFLRECGEALGGEKRARVRHALFLVPGKLGRAARPAADAVEEADAILQAQAAHRALAVVGEAAAAGARVLGARVEALRRQIEARWLSRPSPLLEPVRDGPWWGPLRDVTGTLGRLSRGF